MQTQLKAQKTSKFSLLVNNFFHQCWMQKLDSRHASDKLTVTHLSKIKPEHIKLIEITALLKVIIQSKYSLLDKILD